MALTPEDISDIGKLFDDRLKAYDRRQQTRRWYWRLFWVVIFILSTVLSWAAMKQLMNFVTSMQDQVAQSEREFSEAKLAYQDRLAHDQAMQQERTEAEKAAHYKSAQPQADYEAELMKQAMKLFVRSQKTQATLAQQDLDDPEALEKMSAEMTDVLGDSASTLMRILLRNTDPAHNTKQERATTADRTANSASAHDQQLQSLQSPSLDANTTQPELAP